MARRPATQKKASTSESKGKLMAFENKIIKGTTEGAEATISKTTPASSRY